jgi:mono/diheme cytochrome c family protein
MSLSSAIFPRSKGRSLGEQGMNKLVRNVGMAMLVVLLAGSVCFAQSSAEALYKSKCQMCHGEKGLADSGAGKSMKIKPVTDPDVKKMGEAQMVDAVKNGMGKMQPYKDKLTDAQIKDVVTYFRSFMK